MLTINQAIKGFLVSPDPITGPYIIATSGGPDSQCLLKGVSHVIGTKNCIAVGIDYNLCQTASRQLDIAENLAKDYCVEFQRIKVTVEKGGNLQAKARALRYKALYQRARECDSQGIVMGHNNEDQVETLLSKLLNGNTPTAMKFHTYVGNICIIRPLLLHTRDDINRYLKCWNIPYAQDSANYNPKDLHSWVRAELLPKMKAKSSKVHTNILNFLTQNQLKQYTEEDYQ
jgi:tRNA(Ile)-lysidine synthase